MDATLLEKPRADLTLDELRDQLNALALLRDKARVAFCIRLARVYLLIVGIKPARGRVNGHGPGHHGAVANPKVAEFRKWCAKNLRTANGQAYSVKTLQNYCKVGFSADPTMEIVRQDRRRCAERSHHATVVRALQEAIETPTPPKPIPLSRLRREEALPNDVAQQVSALMHAWEAACPQARRTFMQHVM